MFDCLRSLSKPGSKPGLSVALWCAGWGLTMVLATAWWPARAQQSAPAASPQAGGELEFNRELDRKLAGGQKHRYLLKLSERQLARIVVDQRGIDVNLRLLDQADHLLIEVN